MSVKKVGTIHNTHYELFVLVIYAHDSVNIRHCKDKRRKMVHEFDSLLKE